MRASVSFSPIATFYTRLDKTLGSANKDDVIGVHAKGITIYKKDDGSNPLVTQIKAGTLRMVGNTMKMFSRSHVTSTSIPSTHRLSPENVPEKFGGDQTPVAFIGQYKTAGQYYKDQAKEWTTKATYIAEANNQTRCARKELDNIGLAKPGLAAPGMFGVQDKRVTVEEVQNSKTMLKLRP
jgi:hypothetical protein